MKKIKKGNKVICFTRVSTKLQDLDSQEKEVIAMAKNDGYDESQIILISETESGYCKTEDERIGLTQMKDVIESNNIDCVYVWEVSRIARRLKIIVSISDYLTEHNVNLKVKKENLKMFDDSGKKDPIYTVVMAILGSFAEIERNSIVERTMRTKEQMSNEGFAINGQCCFGYCINAEKRIEVKEDDANIVREIFLMYASGQYSTKQIATLLNERGIEYKKTEKLNKNNRGNLNGEFNQKVINDILSNEVYCGGRNKDRKEERRTKGNLYPSIISNELFEKCKQMRTIKGQRFETSSNKHTLFGKSLLRDMSDIMGDGKGRLLQGKIGTLQYFNNITNKGVSINYVDYILWEIAKQFRAQSRINATEIEEMTQSMQIEVEKMFILQNNLKSIESRIFKINDNFAKGAFDGNEDGYFSIIRECNNKKNEYNNKLIEVRTKIENLKKIINAKNKENIITDETFSNYTNNEKYDLIHQMIKEVEVYRKGSDEVNLKIIFAYNDAISIDAYYKSKKGTITINGIDHTQTYKPRFERKKY